jgi:hypothetical protein
MNRVVSVARWNWGKNYWKWIKLILRLIIVISTFDRSPSANLIWFPIINWIYFEFNWKLTRSGPNPWTKFIEIIALNLIGPNETSMAVISTSDCPLSANLMQFHQTVDLISNLIQFDPDDPIDLFIKVLKLTARLFVFSWLRPHLFDGVEWVSPLVSRCVWRQFNWTSSELPPRAHGRRLVLHPIFPNNFNFNWTLN